MDSLAFLYYLQSAPGYAGQIVHTEPISARNPTYGKLLSRFQMPFRSDSKSAGLPDSTRIRPRPTTKSNL